MIKKILIVDDSELIHNMYRLMLKKYKNSTLVSAKNGRQGLDKLAVEKNVDLILLDINMPVMNGLQFLEEVRNNREYREIPIIIISTEGKEEDTLKGLSMGASGYIVKPFRSDTLHSLIESIFSRRVGCSTVREGCCGIH